MRALVVGGAGFIGSSLVERLLAEDWLVEVVDDLSTGSLERLATARADAAHTLRIHRHDIVDRSTADLVERAAPDRIFFLAEAADGSDPAHRLEVGALGLARVLDGASRLNQPPKVIVTVAGADVHHGSTGTDEPVNEGVAPDPTAVRAIVAASSLAALQAYRSDAGIEHTVLVLSEVYGPSMPARGDLGTAVTGGKGVLPDRGFDLVHLDDTVDALVRSSTRGDGLTINIASGEVVSASEVVSILSGFGCALVVGEPAKNAPPPLAVGRAEIHLGWTPFTPLPVGLRSLV